MKPVGQTKFDKMSEWTLILPGFCPSDDLKCHRETLHELFRKDDSIKKGCFGSSVVTVLFIRLLFGYPMSDRSDRFVLHEK